MLLVGFIAVRGHGSRIQAETRTHTHAWAVSMTALPLFVSLPGVTHFTHNEPGWCKHFGFVLMRHSRSGKRNSQNAIKKVFHTRSQSWLCELGSTACTISCAALSSEITPRHWIHLEFQGQMGPHRQGLMLLMQLVAHKAQTVRIIVVVVHDLNHVVT